MEEQKKEEKIEKKAEEKPVKKIEKPKKTEATLRGADLPISTKHSIAICDFIRNKKIDTAIKQLEDILQYKTALPMRGEIPHRLKGAIPSGRYPQNSIKAFIKMLKNLKANATNVNLNAEKLIISKAIANKANRPSRHGGRTHGKRKRSHVELATIEKIEKEKKKIEK